jgi:HD-like signal output (HDOD) protein
MNFIELLNYLQPYFRSVRKIKQFFSIDLLFPQTWKFPNEIIEKLNVVQDEKYTGTGIAMSFLLDLTTEQEESQLEKIFELISYNLELEEKTRLLKEKTEHLKQIFENNSLDDLQNLVINIEDKLVPVIPKKPRKNEPEQ